MEFRLNIECDNAAFQDGCLESEVARLLRQTAKKIEECSIRELPLTLRDINGNPVGVAAVTSDNASVPTAILDYILDDDDLREVFTEMAESADSIEDYGKAVERWLVSNTSFNVDKIEPVDLALELLEGLNLLEKMAW